MSSLPLTKKVKKDFFIKPSPKKKSLKKDFKEKSLKEIP
ncbi:hypothetical protein N201_06890 [Helicobacter pylori UM066]|nr:hypothetical protein N201_06890 [Helicobacter pylori UM066]